MERLRLPSSPQALTLDRHVFPALPERGHGLPEAIRYVGVPPPYGTTVAVVGTRRTDPEAAEFAFELARGLSRAGSVVVSGGARGIDLAAHEGALSERGRTVAVLAIGFDVAYPPEHAPLFTRIVDSGGALLTMAADGSAPLKGRFLARNALVAAIVDAVVVVQAPARSGALSTAAAAKRFGKPVFAVPSAPWDPRGHGSLGLLARGARVCTRVEDVLSVSALSTRPTPVPRGGKSKLVSNDGDFDGDEGIVLSALGSRPWHVDEVARVTGLPAPRVQRALLSLLLGGAVDEREGGRYVRAVRLR